MLLHPLPLVIFQRHSVSFRPMEFPVAPQGSRRSVAFRKTAL